MFPRYQRLVEKRLFALLFRRGQWVRGKAFSIVYFSAQKEGKIAFIVTRKQAKQATERNRLKRRIRAAFLQLLHTQEFAPLLKQYNLIVVVHRNTNQSDFSSITAEANKQLNQLASTPPSTSRRTP